MRIVAWSFLVIGLLMCLGGAASHVLAETCSYCKPTADASQPACAVVDWGACGWPIPNVNCQANTKIAGTEHPDPTKPIAVCASSKVQLKCTSGITTVPQTACYRDGNKQVTSAGCPKLPGGQQTYKMGCQTIRQNTGASVNVQSCVHNADPECTPDPAGGEPPS